METSRSVELGSEPGTVEAGCSVALWTSLRSRRPNTRDASRTLRLSGVIGAAHRHAAVGMRGSAAGGSSRVVPRELNALVPTWTGAFLF